MKQYCRYCCYLVTGNGIYCEKRERTLSEYAAKAANTCNDFALNPQDAFMENEKGYQPRKPKKKQCDGQLNMMDFIQQQKLPKYQRFPVGTLIGRVVLGEVEKAVITKVEGNDSTFFYRTNSGSCYNPQEAETDMEKLQRIADENREKYITIENYPLSGRITVSYPPRREGWHTLYGQVGIYKNMLYWKDDCTYEFLVPYDSEKELEKAYKEKMDIITGKDGINEWKARVLTMLEHQLPMTRLYWSKHGFYASARYVKTNG